MRKRFLYRTEDGFTLMDTLISLFVFSLIIIGLFRFFTYSLDLVDIRMDVVESQNAYLDLDYRLLVTTKTQSFVSSTSDTLKFTDSEFTIRNNALYINERKAYSVELTAVTPFQVDDDLIRINLVLLQGQERVTFDSTYQLSY